MARACAIAGWCATIDDLFDQMGIATPIDLMGCRTNRRSEAVARTIFRGKARALENLRRWSQSKTTPRERFSCRMAIRS